MKRIPNLLSYCLGALVHRCLCFTLISTRNIITVWHRVRGENRAGKRTASWFGSVRLYGAEDWLRVMDEAISKVKEEDPAVYAGVSGGRKCFVFTPHRKIESWLPYGVFYLNRPFVKSQGALVSLFVFWHFFEEGSSIFERADSEKVESRKRQANGRTAEWLEFHNYSAELVQWMKEGGLVNGVEPPLLSKKKPGGEKGDNL